MTADRLLSTEFAYRPRTAAALDALYVARPGQRSRVAALLGVAIAGTVLGVVLAIAGAAVAVWGSWLVLAALALVVLGWWALTQCQGSVFAAGPGIVHIDDNGLRVHRAGAPARPADAPDGEPVLVPWSSLRGWGETDKVIVLFPAEPADRPLHVIRVADLPAGEPVRVVRELLHWHLGKPKP